MADCVIKKNEFGEITKVVTRDGGKSILFDKIMGIPFLYIEDGIKAYANILSDKFKNKFGDWEKRFAKNDKAVNKIKSQIVGHQNYDNIVSMANTMSNPVLVKKLDYALADRPVYTTNIEGNNDIYLFDQIVSDTVDLSEDPVPDETTPRVFEGEAISENTSPVIDMVLTNGDKVKVISDSQKINDINSITDTSAVSPFTYENGEPKLFFLAQDGRIFDNYGDAIRNTSSGDIDAGFISGDAQIVSTEGDSSLSPADIVVYDGKIKLNNDDAFTRIISVSSDSNIQTRDGVINNLIRKGYLSDNRIEYNGRYYITGAGKERGEMTYNANVAIGYVRLIPGFSGSRVFEDGRIEIAKDNYSKNRVNLMENGPDGMTLNMSKERIKTMLKEGKYEDLKKTYSNIDMLIACLFQEDNQLFHSNTQNIIEDEKARDLSIREGMVKILSSLGISVVGMSDYLARYKQRIGTEPSAKALADLGNKVIALAEGSSVEDLTEEVSHFLVETYVNQDEVTSILPEVENTPQWSKYSKQYYDIYGKNYSGDKLQNIVRREVLGKVLRDEFLDRFSKADQPIENQSFYRKVVDLLANMVRKIQGMFVSDIKSDFNNLVNEMAESALADDPNAFDIRNLDDVDFTLYSAADEKMMKIFSDSRTILQAQLRNAQRSKSGISQQLRGDLSRVEKSINELSKEINDVNVRSSITNLVATAEAQTNYLSKLVKAYNNAVKKGTSEAMFGLVDQSNLDNINSLMAPMISQLRGFIDTDSDLKLEDNYKRQILKRIDSVNAKVSALNAEVNALRKIDNNTLLNRLMDTFNVDEEGRKMIIGFLTNAMKDVSLITKWFGTLEHSRNPILGMLMGYISWNNYNANIRTQGDMEYLIQRAEKESYDVRKFENLLQKDGDYYSSYLKSEVDYVKFRNEFEKAQAKAFKEAFPEVKEDIDTILKDGVKIGDNVFKPNIHGVRLNFLSEDQLQKYEDSFNDWLKDGNIERRFLPEYYKEVESIYESAAVREDGSVRAISRESRDFMADISARTYQVKSRFMDKNGRVDRLSMYRDINAVEELKEIRRSKRQASSYIDPMTGNRKEGRELELAQDIRAIDKAWGDFFKKNGEAKNVDSSFIKELRRVQDEDGMSAAFDFLIANSSIRFSDNFWGSLGDPTISQVEKILDPESEVYRKDFDGEPITKDDMASLRVLVDEVTELRKKQKEIMRIYYESDTPGEIDYDNMTEESKQQILNIQEELQQRNSMIRNITKDPSFDSDVETEYTNNQAFDKALADSLDDTFSFCRKHATRQNQDKMDIFRRKMDNLSKGKAVSFNPAESRMIAEKTGIDIKENISKQLTALAETDPALLNKLVDEYAKSMVLPYFKRFAPKGYDEWINSVRYSDVTKMTERILAGKGNGIESMITIEPTRDWQSESSYFDKYINPNYKENSEYGYYQPSQKYRDEDYYKHFGIGEGSTVATQNVGEWNMIQQLVGLKRKALSESGYNEGPRSRHNLYEIPQISKSTIEKLYQFKDNPKITLRNALRDLASVRVDDPIYGQSSDLNVEGVDMTQFKVIPKYYLRELGEKSDVSHDLIRSYTLFMLQANLYDEKMKTIGDVMGMQQMLLNAKFEKGVIPQNTKTYEMFKEWMESHFYGIKVNSKKMEVEILGKKIDVSKAAMNFDKFVRYHNLAFSIPVALTGAVTGQLNAVVEGAVGQYVNLPSMRFADKEMLKLTSGYISEVGKIDRRNKLYVLGEKMGVYSISHRTASAGYNRAIRILGNNLGYEMMDVLNYPLAPKMMISVMDDTRMADDGKFYRFNSFARKVAYDEREAGRTISNKEIKSRWDALKDKSLYSILDVKDGKLEIKEGFDKDVVERQMRVAQREIRSLNNICDGALSPEDKSSAARNWMMNFTMAHRGWFQIAFQRRWKAKGYNFSTNQIEEGSNRTILRYLSKSLSLLKEGNIKELFDVINQNWSKMPDWEKKNLYRCMIDMSVFMLGTLVWTVAMSYDDDDDESSWIGQMTSYTALRTINEMYSQLPGLLEVNAVETMYNPFPVMAKLRDLVMPKNWSLDEVQSGSYQGESKLWRLFAKQTFIKQWYSLSTAEDVQRTKKGWLLNNPVMFFKKPGDDDNNSGE